MSTAVPVSFSCGGGESQLGAMSGVSSPTSCMPLSTAPASVDAGSGAERSLPASCTPLSPLIVVLVPVPVALSGALFPERSAAHPNPTSNT